MAGMDNVQLELLSVKDCLARGGGYGAPASCQRHHEALTLAFSDIQKRPLLGVSTMPGAGTIEIAGGVGR